MEPAAPSSSLVSRFLCTLSGHAACSDVLAKILLAGVLGEILPKTEDGRGVPYQTSPSFLVLSFPELPVRPLLYSVVRPRLRFVNLPAENENKSRSSREKPLTQYPEYEPAAQVPSKKTPKQRVDYQQVPSPFCFHSL